MKKIRFIALAMALLMIAISVAACSPSEKVSVKCTVTIDVEGETYLENYEYTVTNKVDTPPTVLQAVTEVLTTLEYPYATDANGLSLTSITLDEVEYASGLSDDETAIFTWACTIDGEEPKGRMGNTLVEEGQHIYVYYYKQVIDEPDYSEEGEE